MWYHINSLHGLYLKTFNLIVHDFLYKWLLMNILFW
ncbi:hypothetical protein Slin_6995 (plasmid) [Spirosoma linguale DSM 74]|uniref:Uncharacterized protein n=1 Tax=Spirosoma linguale (strain ATCC 33905 / DSM 74 / LMG 10896 / Claus 1) TaxID=504472 RepID=D2QVV6_SPILD|nr:hypothetical protein Slin_6995 [Spirosoma linguale DSM 74]